MDKYQLLIDLGNEQEPLDDKYKTEQNLIDGCQSRVWLQADLVKGENAKGEEVDVAIHQVGLQPYTTLTAVYQILLSLVLIVERFLLVT